ncbi:hypothetical protein [Vannielia litorea]|uniref:hypothetical protein n=1 Tax=Vannielia litorea TaxID=1217970 RepID=UPI001BCFFE47|nr:hypothetical protein [Vannielia litorea]
MGRKRTMALAGLLAVLSTPARAEPLDMVFAACTGRFSALMEHQWLIPTPEVDTTTRRRAAMISLLEAVMPAGRGREVLARRIEAKHAQAVLLTRATFNDDAEDAQWAATRAEAEIASCAALLTG